MFIAHDPQIPALKQKEGKAYVIFQAIKSQNTKNKNDTQTLSYKVDHFRAHPDFLTFSAGAAKCQSGVHLIFDFDESIKDHGTTTLERRRRGKKQTNWLYSPLHM